MTSASALYQMNRISEQEVSRYDLNIHEQTLILSYLQIGKRYLMELHDPRARGEAERLQQYRDLIAMMQGKRGVVKHHERHNVFTLSDAIGYYADKDHIISSEARKVLETYVSGRDISEFYVDLDTLTDSVMNNPRYKNYTRKHVALETEAAAKRLRVRGYASLFPGTPKFKVGSVCVNIPAVRDMIESITAPKTVPKKPSEPERGLMNPELSGDIPPFYPDDVPDCTIEFLADSDVAQIRHDSERSVDNLESLSEEQRFILGQALANNNCVNLQWVLERALESSVCHQYRRKNLYQRLYRAAKGLEAKGIISIKKGMESLLSVGLDGKNMPVQCNDGLLWIILDRDKARRIVLGDTSNCSGGTEEKDLIKGYCKIPTDEITPEKQRRSRRDPYAMPKCGNTRKAAIRYLMGVNMLDPEENQKDRILKRHSQGPYRDMKEIMNLFGIYQSETLQKIIALLNTITGETIGFDYSTRFNDYAKGVERLKRYEWAHDRSLEDFNEAVFVTLTTDPKNFPNLWTANRHSSQAWNTFMQILTAELGDRKDRPKFIAAFEYTKTGLLHIHAMIFGRRYLHSDRKYEERDWISRKWNESCGQGKIVDAYGLRNVLKDDGHREWQWYNREDHPHDAGRLSGGDYLKKYLKKCMLAVMDRYNGSESTLAQYWAENKRFSSCSRSFIPPKDVDLGCTDESGTSKFVFLMIGYGMDVDDAANMGIIDRIAYRRFDPDRIPEVAEAGS